MSDPYEFLKMENDLISKEIAAVEKAVDDMIKNKEASQKNKISKWGTRSTANTIMPEQKEEKKTTPAKSSPKNTPQRPA